MPVRPKSIVWFEIAFWVMVVIGIAQAALQWNAILVDRRFAPLIAKIGVAPIYGIVVVLLVLLALLWYFIARRRSVVAKWIFVLLSAYTLYDAASGLMAGGWPTTLPALLTYGSLVIQFVAVVLLFMPDTRPWFGEDETAA